MNHLEFKINDIDIRVESIIPIEISDEVSGKPSYIKKIRVGYFFTFIDEFGEDFNIKEIEIYDISQIKINSNFIQLEDLTKEHFKNFLINECNNSKKIQDRILKTRRQRGLEPWPLKEKINIDIRKFKSIN